MKAGLRVLLIFCHAVALVSAVAGVSLFLVKKTGTALLFAAVVIPLVSLVVQYVFLGFWNPLKLFKKSHVEIADTEVTKAPWAH